MAEQKQLTASIDDFEFIKFLGKGAYGGVWMVRKKQSKNDLFALKIVDMQKSNDKNYIKSL